MVLTTVSFYNSSVKELHRDSFTVDRKDLVCLTHPECVLVLFHLNNPESEAAKAIWLEAAEALELGRTTTRLFAAVNLRDEPEIREAFSALKADPSSPHYWLRFKTAPFVVVYRNGWPVASYNGHMEVQSIVDYTMTLACEASYIEREVDGASLRVADEHNYVKSGYNTAPPRATSREYRVDAPMMRDYSASEVNRLVDPKNRGGSGSTTATTTSPRLAARRVVASPTGSSLNRP